MAASNRAARLTKLATTLKKHFKPSLSPERPLFESLLYGCMLENSPHEAADQAIEQLESAYFDWNEVRVSTRTELSEVLKPLHDSMKAADRLKRTLQSVFETFYAFDLEPMKKQNLGQSVKQLSECDGVTPFVVAYVTQNGLGGHAIALNHGVLLAMRVMDIISDSEFAKKVVPGLERAIPKNKGVEAGALLHLLGVEISKSPYGTNTRKLLLELDPTCKDRLPKRPTPPKPKPAPKPKPEVKKEDPKKEAAKKAEAKKAEAKKAELKKAEAKKAEAKKAAEQKAAAKKPATKKPATKKPAAPKKVAPKKKVVKKKTVKKKIAKKTTATKKPTKKAATKKSTPNKAVKKPTKKTAKKPAAKKPAAKKKPVKKAAAAKKPAKKAATKKAAAKKRKPK